MKVAIIGAGPCGLLTKAAFEQVKKEHPAEVVVFERYSQIGGLWNLSSMTGVDVDGLPVH